MGYAVISIIRFHCRAGFVLNVLLLLSMLFVMYERGCYAIVSLCLYVKQGRKTRGNSRSCEEKGDVQTTNNEQKANNEQISEQTSENKKRQLECGRKSRSMY